MREEPGAVRGERRNQHDVSSDSCRMLRDAETGKRSRSQQRAGGRKGVFQTQGTAQCGDGTEDASSTGTWQLHIVLCQQHLKKVMTLEKLNSAPLPLSAGPGHAPGRKAGNIRL